MELIGLLVLGIATGLAIANMIMLTERILEQRDRMQTRRRAGEIYQELQQMWATANNPTAAIMNDPARYELAMHCLACGHDWYPKAQAEIAPCPNCRSVAIVGNAIHEGGDNMGGSH